jgi:mycothiol synthase
MTNNITIRNYCPDDLPALVALINEADAFDKLERATTLQEMEHELSFPTIHPETDCFLAWDGDGLVGYSDLYVRPGNPEAGGESTIYCWGVVHPQWRRRGLGRRLLETAYRRAGEYAAQIDRGPLNFQCNACDVEKGRQALYQGFNMKPVRYFVNLARSLNGNLPPLEVPEGIRLRTFDPEHDVELVWQVDNTAFRDHWGYTEGKLEEFLHWIQIPYLRPELWFLAEEVATGQVVGLGLNIIDPDWIAQTGRQEGYVDTLAVLREHRKRGLGTTLLVRSLYALRDAGMEAAHLHADADNLTGAMRLYERVGFRVRKTEVAYRRVVQDG